MRNEFASTLLDLSREDERIVLLSGDLGFMALEKLRDQLGPRFINAGVAEQNMVSVAAGLASRGFLPWVYSIAPFVTLRAYEQLRNDVCAHKLPVRVVGNGGGFGYGIMGATHHALEDIGIMQLLPGMRVLVPAFAGEVEELTRRASMADGPVYLRLGRGLPGPLPTIVEGWRRLARGTRGVALTTGPVAGGLLQTPGFDLEIYSVSEFPLESVPDAIVSRIEETGVLITLEEHLKQGGLGESVARLLLGRLGRPIRFLPLAAEGYVSGRYGSQGWHLEECGLAGRPLAQRLEQFWGSA